MSTQVTLTCPPTLPWVRDRSQLPGPLPTRTQIETATTKLPSIYSTHVRRTVLVDGMFVVKYGPVVFENEGHALLFVENYPDIPAPLLYAMYREDENLYIVMEYMHGTQLSGVWPSLLENEKMNIVSQLRLACNALRSIASPGYFGGTLGGPVPHRFFFSLEKDPRITGPFTTELDLCRALVLRSAKNWEDLGRRGWISDFFARHIPTTLEGHNSIFTHADFQRKNILVQEEDCPAEDGSKLFRVTAILDWESAGWYPSYWAYAASFIYFVWSDDWPEKFEQILEPFVNEAAVLRLIGQDLD